MYGMTQITDNLWISDIQSVREESTSQFETVVSVCQDRVSDNVGCDYRHENLADGIYDTYGGDCTIETFSDGVEHVVVSLEQNRTTLVHCHAGISRSVSVSIAALATTTDIDPMEALEQIREHRPQANPNEILQKRIAEYLGDEEFAGMVISDPGPA